MEELNIPYSLKNIPHHSRNSIRKQLVRRAEDVISRIRWKLFFIRNPQAKEDKETFGFRTTNTAPVMDELKPFENDLLQLVKSVKFKPVANSDFKKQMQRDLQKIKETTDKVIVKGDKSRNLYKVSPDDYKKSLEDIISTKYESCDRALVRSVNEEAADVARLYEIEDRVDALSEGEAFMQIKDHKEGFPQRIEYRLLNPSKSSIGALSKKFLDKINSKLRTKTGLNQWKSTNDVLKWFEAIPDKQDKKFLKYDIINFYPDITFELLKEALNWAKNYTEIDSTEEAVILHVRQNFLFFNGNPYTKTTNPEFDVAQGGIDSAELSELVGSFLLSQLERWIPKNQNGIFRDDGLLWGRFSGRQFERLRKNIHDLFKKHKLGITAEANLRTVNYLDVTMSLADGTYKPYRKSNNEVPVYIHKDSNHAPSVKRGLTRMISNRISDLSSSEEIFNSVAPIYNQALRNSGFNEEIVFSKDRQRKRTRNRKIIFFNPPRHDSIRTCIGAQFIRLIGKHFPVGSELSRYFNTQNLKVSYSNMPNFDRIIKAQNKRILNPEKVLRIEDCDCAVKGKTCCLGGNCNTKSLVYRGEVKYTETNPRTNVVEERSKIYLGLTEHTFFQRHKLHKTSFTNQRYSGSTALSSFIWDLKAIGVNFEVDFSIVKLARPYNRESKVCDLCLTEKTEIMYFDHQDHYSALNKRSEIMSKCRHRAKHLLFNW